MNRRTEIWSWFRNCFRWGTVIVAVTVVSRILPAHADVVLNNLGTTGNNANFGFLNIGQGQAIRFVTGPQIYALDSITIRVAGDSFWSIIETRTATVSLRLYGDTGGTPGGLLTDFGSRTLIGSNVVQETFETTDLTLLTPNTSYWVAMVKEGESEHARTTWYSGAVAGGTIFTDPQTGWQLYHGAIGTRDDGQTWAFPTSFEGSIQILASTIPEPTTPSLFLLLCSGLLGKRAIKQQAAVKTLTNTSPESASVQ